MFDADQMLGVKRRVMGTAVAFDGQHVGTHRVLMHPDAQPVELVPEFDFPFECHYDSAD